MKRLTPYTFFEADVALYPAWKDGTPMSGPNARHKESAVFASKANLTITRIPTPSSPSHLDFTGTTPPDDSVFSISIDFGDGATEDDYSRIQTRIHHGGFHILVVRIIDSASNAQWTRLQYFYVTLAGDSLRGDSSGGGDSISLKRNLSLQAGWEQEDVGDINPPSMLPEVRGEVDWICGSKRITCLTYNPDTLTWVSTEQNSLGEGLPPILSLGNVEGEDSQFFSLMLPRLTEGGIIQWEATTAFIVDGTDLIPQPSFTLQQNGTTEPLLAIQQSRTIDEPIAVFRFLRMIYFSVGHQTVAIPSIISGSPPLNIFRDFRIGDLSFLPSGAYTNE